MPFANRTMWWHWQAGVWRRRNGGHDRIEQHRLLANPEEDMPASNLTHPFKPKHVAVKNLCRVEIADV